MEPDAERLAQEFVTLCEIASPSRSEAGLCRRLQERFKELHADYTGEDRSAKETGADCGNLLVRFKGTLPRPKVFGYR